MYIVRDIFQLKFGHFRPIKLLWEEAMQKDLMPDSKNKRALSDFTGNSYRFIFETSYETLADYEKDLSSTMPKPEMQEWYKKFSEHVESSHREILKVLI
jgi:hypothetical protein